jgi:hypothetical protein
MFVEITATAKSLIATYLSFKANKYITLSYGQSAFCSNKSTLEGYALGMLNNLSLLERTTGKGLVVSNTQM